MDSKWEIPREDLLLEHILGEGQFGRVLKGRLHGHAGNYIRYAYLMSFFCPLGRETIHARVM